MVKDTIVAAIRQRTGLFVNYCNTERYVCPHRIGVKRAVPRPKKPRTFQQDQRKYGNHINVFVYQYGGYSSRGLAQDGSPENWRCWALEDIYAATIVSVDRWHTSTAWGTKYSACIDDVIAGV
jgi:hypothetical protein